MRTSSLDLYRQVLFPSLVAGVRIAGLFHPRIREAFEARRGWQKTAVFGSPAGDRIRIHVHVASAGELEQALGIRSAFERIRQDVYWSVSFSSPSGRRHLDNRSEKFDTVSYLPLDRQSEVGKFLDLVRPDAILFIRYDLWPIFVEESRSRGIPMMLACGTIGEGRLQTPLIRTLTRGTLASLTRISAVSADEAERLRRAAPGVPVQIDGDARLDRVFDRGARGVPAEVDLVRSWIAGRQAIVLGSTWPQDEELWAGVEIPEGTVLVIVPHHVDPEHIADLRGRFDSNVLLSEFQSDVAGEQSSLREKVLIIDALGLLADLYRLGLLAWVGGGFGEGVHSVAEPAAAGLPVLAGPRIERSRDAVALERNGGLRVIRDATGLRGAISDLLPGGKERSTAERAVAEWVGRERGGASRIAEALSEMIDRVVTGRRETQRSENTAGGYR